MIEQVFLKTAANYCPNTTLIKQQWLSIAEQYNQAGRHYHTLVHIQNMYQALLAYKNEITNWPAVVFAIIYHDVIYRVQQQDNEEQSAAFATNALQRLQVPPAISHACQQLILATSHTHQTNNDMALFIDADLAILGQNAQIYQLYSQQIRQEYMSFPDEVYKPGRAQVLSYFLSKSRLFVTAPFYNLYEKQARINLQTELLALKTY